MKRYISSEIRTGSFEAALPVASSSVTASAGGNRLGLLMGLVPVLLLSGMAFTGLARRFTTAPMGTRIAEAAAIAIALDTSRRLTDNPADALTATLNVSRSPRRPVTLEEWGVVCNTTKGKYLYRINAVTGAVYAINHLGSDGNQTADAPEPVVQGDINLGNVISPTVVSEDMSSARSRAETEHVARGFLMRLGISTGELNLGKVEVSKSVVPDSPDDAAWTFTYPWRDTRSGNLGLKVTVNASTGTLENLWNSHDVL